MSQYFVSLILSDSDQNSRYGVNTDVSSSENHLTISYRNLEEFATDAKKNVREALNGGFSNIYIKCSTATCREVVVSSISDVISTVSRLPFTPYLLPIINVQIIYEWGARVTGNHPIVEKLEEFRSIFFSALFSPWGLVISGDNVILTAKFTDYSTRDSLTYTISYLLWIFRNPDILDNVLETFRGQKLPNLTPLFQYLSVEFLKHSNWGNSSNIALNLSLFSYAMCKSVHLSPGNNGPSNVVHRLPIRIVWGFVEDIYMKLYPNHTSLKLEHLSSSGQLGESISKLVNLLRKNSNKESTKEELSNPLFRSFKETVEVDFDEEDD